MTCEIILEIIYKRNRLIKNFFIYTSVHQNRFRTEHFRYFRKHRTSALAYKLIGKSSYKRICGKSRKAVTAAALQTDNKLRHITFFTFLIFRIFGKLAYKTQPLTDFIIKILRTHKFNSVFVNFTENCFKYGNIIIFAAQSQHKHTCRIRVIDKTLKDVLSHFLVVAKLRTTKRMYIIKHTVTHISVQLISLSCKYFGRLVHAADSVHNPNFISYTDFAVCTSVTHKSAFFRFRHFVSLRFVFVFKHTA